MPQNQKLSINRPLVLFLLCLTLTITKPAFSQQPPTSDIEPEPTLEQTIEKECREPRPITAPLELGLVRATALNSAPGIATDRTISQQKLTVPSLWWAKEQFGSKLLNNWVAYAPTGIQPGRVDIVVNRQYWSLLNYLERYQFINKFGNIVRDYQYNLRVFNPQGTFLAAYTCTNNTDCQICLQSTPKVMGNR